MPEQKLKGKVAVIGGASKNLGSLISKTLGEEGASVVVHCNSASSKSPAEETVKAVKAAGGDAFAIQGDFTKVAEIEKVFQEAKSVTVELTLLSTLSVNIEETLLRNNGGGIRRDVCREL